MSEETTATWNSLTSWAKKTCVPSLEHSGGRGATKTGLSIQTFSVHVASRRQFGQKTLIIML